jgi:hypothetical protein
MGEEPITISKNSRRGAIEGTGIFGKKVDEKLKKAGIKKLAYKVGDAAKPMVQSAIDAGIVMAGSQVPMLTPAFMSLGGVAKQYLDKPGDFGVGVNDLPKASTPEGMAAQSAMNYLNASGAGHMANIYTDPYASLNMLADTHYGNRAMSAAGNTYNNQLAQEYQNAQRFAQHQAYTSPVFTGGLNAPSVLQSAAVSNPFKYNDATGMPQIQSALQTAGQTIHQNINHAASNPNSMSNPLPLAPTQPTPTFASAPAPPPTSNPDHAGAKVATTARKNLMGMGLGLGIGGYHHAFHHVQNQMHPIRGLGVKRRHGKSIEKGSVGVHGNLLRSPQALVSQPYSANPMWASTLPPSYQRFNDTA